MLLCFISALVYSTRAEPPGQTRPKQPQAVFRTRRHRDDDRAPVRTIHKLEASSPTAVATEPAGVTAATGATASADAAMGTASVAQSSPPPRQREPEREHRHGLGVHLPFRPGPVSHWPCVDDSISSMLCSNSGPPPTIALCVSGAARTFANQLVHRSLLENFIQRIGARVVPMAFLKLNDGRGDERAGFNAKIHAEEDATRGAAAAIGVDEHDLIVKQDSYNPPPNCSGYAMFGPGHCKDDCDHMEGVSNQQSLLGQLENRAKCFELMEQHEKRTGTRFDWLVVARPDLTWFRPVAPWCLHKVTGYGKIMWDWVWWMPRAAAFDQFWKPFRDHHTCEADFKRGDSVEMWSKRHTKVAQMSQAKGTVPVVVTRYDKASMPNNVCGVMNRPELRTSSAEDISPACREWSFANVCNAPAAKRDRRALLKRGGNELENGGGGLHGGFAVGLALCLIAGIALGISGQKWVAQRSAHSTLSESTAC